MTITHDAIPESANARQGQGMVVHMINWTATRAARSAWPPRWRLHLWTRRLVRLKPLLLRYGFGPRATGIRATLPQSDRFRAGRFIGALAAPAEAPSDPSDGDGKARLTARPRG